MNEIEDRYDDLCDVGPGLQDPLRFFFQMGAAAAVIDFLRLCIEGEKPMDAVAVVQAHLNDFAKAGEQGTVQ